MQNILHPKEDVLLQHITEMFMEFPQNDLL